MTREATTARLTVTVGVIARRRSPALARLLAALERQSRRPDEVVFAVERPDARVVSERDGGDGVRWLEILGGQGLGFNRNRVVEAASSEVLVFTDDDCEPGDDWLASLLEPLGDGRVRAVVSGVRIPPAGLLADAIAALGFPAGGNAGYETMFGVAEDGATENLTTCNCAIRTSVFARIGGFDETLTLGGEDTAFGARMCDAGLRIVYEPSAEVVHEARGNLGEFARWFFRRGRAKRQFASSVPSVGPFVGRRLASYAAILKSRRGDPKLPVIFLLMLSSVLLQQAGFIAESLFPARPEPVGREARVVP